MVMVMTLTMVAMVHHDGTYGMYGIVVIRMEGGVRSSQWSNGGVDVNSEEGYWGRRDECYFHPT